MRAVAALAALAAVATAQPSTEIDGASFAASPGPVLHNGETASFTASFGLVKAFNKTAGEEWPTVGETLYMAIKVNGELIKNDTVTILTGKEIDAFASTYDAESGDVATYSYGVDVVVDGRMEPELFYTNNLTEIAFIFGDDADLAAEAMARISQGGASFHAIGAGVSLVPLIVVLFLAVVTQKVELALYMGIFVGAFIVADFDLASGWKASLDNYILNSAADYWHQYVMVFTLFLSGLVGMMEKAGGLYGLSTALLRYAKDSRSAQMLAFICGFLLFFDDYSNALVIGASMRPVLDSLFVSREKLAFIVDATSAPIAAIVPVSSWIAFETGEIQSQLDKIIESYKDDTLPAELEGASGFTVYIKSLPFRFYPIFMIFFQIILIMTKREFGPMLIAERKTQVYKRTDGGDAALANTRKLSDVNKPKKDTPLRAYNMLLPILLLVFFIVWVMFYGAAKGLAPEERTFNNVLGGVDSYAALLFGTFAASIITVIFYAIQFKEDGNIVPPNPAGYCRKSEASVIGVNIDDEDEVTEAGARPLLFPSEAIDAWLHGLSAIFPAIVVLVLAWAIASAMTDVGADRLFSSALEGSGIQGGLPALTFVLSLFMALCTGTSWGTMGIMYPLTLVSAWNIAHRAGDYGIFYATVASILSGAVCGDHCSPISDTTVLSSVASQCELTAHVFTQLPYALFVALVSVLLGFLPAGFGMPAVVGILVGPIVMGGFIFLYAKPVLSSTGSFDLLTELYLKVAKQDQLREDTINYDPSAEPADAVVADSKMDL